jgi:hypothetical protein
MTAFTEAGAERPERSRYFGHIGHSGYDGGFHRDETSDARRAGHRMYDYGFKGGFCRRRIRTQVISGPPRKGPADSRYFTPGGSMKADVSAQAPVEIAGLGKAIGTVRDWRDGLVTGLSQPSSPCG